MAECPCGKVFEPKNRDQLYHEVKCARDGAAQGLKPRLKAPFMGRVKVRGLTRRAAADQAGIGYSALRTWWQTPGSRLKADNLARLAAWLEISVDEAIRLQDGTAEERWLEIGREARAVQHKRVRDNPRLAKQAVERMAKAVRGTHHSEEHREGIRRGLKAYRRGLSPRRPDPHELHTVDNDALEQKLNTDLLNRFKRWRLDRNPTDHEIRDWEELASARYDVCRGRVRVRWNVLLKKRGLPGLGGNPADIETCDEACAFLETHVWTGPQRPWRYWQGAPANADQQWCQGHAKFCPRLRKRYAGKLQKSPTTLQKAEITA